MYYSHVKHDCVVFLKFVSQEDWKRMSSKYLLHGKDMNASEGEYLV